MYKDKANSFKVQIRRQQINAIFQKKRKEFNHEQKNTYSHQHSQHSQSQLFNFVSNKYHGTHQSESSLLSSSELSSTPLVKLTIFDLQIIARFSQNEMGIRNLKKTDFPQMAALYLSEQYNLSKQQQLATVLFVNLTWMKEENCPEESLMEKISLIVENCVSSTEQKNRGRVHQILDNGLNVVYNLLTDYKQAVDFFVKKKNLIKILYAVLDNFPARKVVYIIMKLLLFMGKYLCDSDNALRRDHRKCLKFFIAICRDSSDGNEIYGALSNIESILSNYAQDQYDLNEIKNQLFKSRILNKLLLLASCSVQKQLCNQKQFGSDNLRPVINLLRALFQKFDLDFVEKTLIPFINRMAKQIQECPQLNSMDNNDQYQSIQLRNFQKKCICTELVYMVLKNFPNDHGLCANHEISSRMQSLFQEQQNLNLIKSYITIFGLMYLSDSITNHAKDLLERSIDKMDQVRKHDSQFDSLLKYIQESINKK